MSSEGSQLTPRPTNSSFARAAKPCLYMFIALNALSRGGCSPVFEKKPPEAIINARKTGEMITDTFSLGTSAPIKTTYASATSVTSATTKTKGSYARRQGNTTRDA
uniref:Uncharacterized protein n=1 Tax=Chrysotila carterae TaxID=13221 RepID=A0A7S4BCG2_CHRCT